MSRDGDSRGTLLAAIACVLIATLLRLWHVDHDLPDFNEEAMIFRKALEMWGPDGRHADLNPHFFVYPSLTIYIHFLVQHLSRVLQGFVNPADFLLSLTMDPSKTVVMSRWVSIIADAVTVVLVGRMARPFGAVPAVLAMGLTAFAPVMIRTSRLIYTDSVMCTLSLLAVERMLAYREHGSQRSLAAAAACVGLAAGAKYPALLLVIPLTVAVVFREPRTRVPRSLATAAGIAVAGFLCTTPSIVVSGSEFLRDAVLTSDVATLGGLGKLRGPGLPHDFAELVRNLGVTGVALMGLALLPALRARFQDGVGLMWLAWFGLFVPIAVIPVEADRYLVMPVALGAALAAVGAAQAIAYSGRLRAPAFRMAPVALLAACLVLPMVSGWAAARSGRSSTQREARLWCVQHLEEGTLILSEAYGPNLLSYYKRAEVMADPLFDAASPSVRQQYQSQPAFHVVSLPLIVSGYAAVRLPTRDAKEIAVYAHAVGWNAAVYDVRFLQAADYVITTGAVRGRFASDTARFREQVAFYGLLDHLAERVAEFRSDPDIEGPEITVYRSTPQLRQAAIAAGRLDTLWWARTIPPRFKTMVDSTLSAGVAPSEFVGGLPLWAEPLRRPYAERYGRFATELAQNAAALGHRQLAEDLTRASLTVWPEDLESALVYAHVASGDEGWADVDRVLGRSAEIMRRSGPEPSALLLARADVLSRRGAKHEASLILEDVLRRGDPEFRDMAVLRLSQLNRQP